MLTPFTALLPNESGVEYWALERAAKALRADPARYQSVEGVSYRRSEHHMFRWEIEFSEGRVRGLVGLFPLDRLIPHEDTRPGNRRPQHPVQIRPVMALVDASIPETVPTGDTVHFRGEHHHSVTPVEPVSGPWAEGVIADGHHRVAAAIRAARDPMIMTMLVSIDDAALSAGTFHRVFSAATPLPTEVKGCDVIVETLPESVRAGRIAVVTPNGTVGVAVENVSEPLAGLPAGLAARYLYPALGLSESDADYVAELRDALGAVDEGATAIVLPESSVGSVLAAAQEGVTVPPKSTRFRPKPIRGLLMREVP